jgi:conjugal transfer mating pair stabilization protein TraN
VAYFHHKFGRFLSIFISIVIVAQQGIVLYRATAASATFLLVAYSVKLYATDASDGEGLGQSLHSGFQMPVYDGSGTIDLNNPAGDSINYTELFPETAYGNTDHVDNFHSGEPLTADLVDTSNRLQTEISGTGEAYRLMETSRWDVEHPNLYNDPIFNATRDTLHSTLPADFQDCTTVKTITYQEDIIHIPDLKSCNIAIKPTQACEITHDYSLDHVVRFLGGAGSLSSCGDGCLVATIGREGDNNLRPPAAEPGSNCGIIEQDITLEVNRDLINSITVTYLRYEQFIQFWVDDNMVSDSPSGVFPPETPGNCSSGDYDASPNRDITSYFPTRDTYNLKIRTSMNAGDDGGEGFARILIRYDPAAIIKNESWSESAPGCLGSAAGVTDGFCEGKVRCTSNNITSQCHEFNGVSVCQSDFEESPVVGVSEFCRTVEVVSSSCDFTGGQFECWIDSEGNEQCPTTIGTEDFLSDCEALENDSNCHFLREECVGNATGDSGTCYLKYRDYDCGYANDVDMGHEVVENKFICNGPIRCMGTECITRTAETNNDFGTVAAYVQGMQMTGSDMDCPTTGYCTVFEGTPGYCKKAVGGIVDCCEETEGVSIADYMQLLKGASYVAEQAELGTFLTENGMDVAGAWNDFTAPMDEAWTAFDNQLISAWDNIFHSGTNVAGAGLDAAVQAGTGTGDVSTSIARSSITEKITWDVSTWVGDSFGAAVEESLFGFDAGGNYVFGGEGAFAGQAMIYIYYIYVVYMIFIAVVNILYECEEIELETMMNEALGNCHKVGEWCEDDILGSCIDEREGYCCYLSPFSRIMAEQLKPQLGMGWGEPENPNCAGIGVHQFEDVNWDLVDLREWVDLLKFTGNIPNNSPMGDMTNGFGTAEGLGVDGQQRSYEAITGGNPMDVIRNTARDNLWGTQP